MYVKKVFLQILYLLWSNSYMDLFLNICLQKLFEMRGEKQKSKPGEEFSHWKVKSGSSSERSKR